MPPPLLEDKLKQQALVTFPTIVVEQFTGRQRLLALKTLVGEMLVDNEAPVCPLDACPTRDLLATYPFFGLIFTTA